MQEILVIVSVIAALLYLGFRAYKKFTNKNKCDDNNCGCH